jgi:hypothetical protein
VPTYRTGNNAYCIQSIGAAGGTGVAVANTASAIFGLQRQDLAYDTSALQRSYRDFTFDPAQYQGEQETAPVLPSEGGAVGSWDFAGTAAGQTTKRGTGTGSWTYAGTAVGSTTKRGTGTGTFTLTGTSRGWNGLPFTEDFSSGTWDNWTKEVNLGTVEAGFTVSGGAGVLVATDPVLTTRSRAVLAHAPTTTSDQGVLFSVITIGTEQVLGVTLRGDGTWSSDVFPGTGYVFVLYGSVLDYVDFISVVAGVETYEGSTSGTGSIATRTHGSKYWVRAETLGSTARVRVWADGAPEPTTWTVADDGTGTVTSGTLQIAAYNSGFSSTSATLDDITYYEPSSEGIGAGSWGFAGTATGTTQKRGTAVGGLTYTGTATGSTVKAGTATGSIAWTSEAAGTTTKRGTSSGLTTWAGAAVGDAPVPGVQEGSGSGTWVYAGAALGITTKRGASVGTWNYTGTAVGDAPAILSPGAGTATGTWTFLGSATSGATTTPTPADRILLVPASQRIEGVSSRGLRGSVTYADRILPVYEDERMEEVVT